LTTTANPKDESMGQTRGATPKQELTGLYPGERASVRIGNSPDNIQERRLRRLVGSSEAIVRSDHPTQRGA
jgi:hypothetical protein